MQKWGIEISNSEASWAECSTNGRSTVLFAEFCDWAITKSLEFDEEDQNDEVDEGQWHKYASYGAMTVNTKQSSKNKPVVQQSNQKLVVPN